jgi:hypothetical protein
MEKTLSSQIVTLLALFVLGMLSLLNCVRIWIFRRNYFREQFSLSLAILFACLVLFAMISIGLEVMPWHLGQFLLASIFQERLPALRYTFSDPALLLVLCMVSFELIRRAHGRWSGAKSLDQYRREQRNEPLEFQGEAIFELRRILWGRPRLEPHLGQSERNLPSQLQSPSQAVSWRDRARDLVRLSSSAYVFDKDSGWRDSELCWVGSNLDSDRLVLLHPAHSMPNEERLAALSRYASLLASNVEGGGRSPEIVVALIGNATLSGEFYYESVFIKTEEMLLRSLVDFSDYRNEIRRRVTLVNLPEADLSISETYVASEVVAGDSSAPRMDVEPYISEWLSSPGQRQLALLGEYGQGKSTTTLMYTFRALCSSDLFSDRIPILIELRGTSPRNLDPLGLLGAWRQNTTSIHRR